MPGACVYVSSTRLYMGETLESTATRSRLVTRAAISTPSASEVEPSYMPALATSMPVSCAHSVWNSNSV